MAKRKFTVPKKEEVSESNRAIFENFEKNFGFVPNLAAYFAKNETALPDYMAFQLRKSSLSLKEREAISLVVSEVNGCRYCQSAHTIVAQMNGFSEEQILELRKGYFSLDSRIDALVKFAQAVTEHRGRIPEGVLENFFESGYTEANMIDVFLAIGEKTVSNYIHNLTELEINFPVAPELK
ncbi:alkyl hydroperoxide reductase AhpD [Cytophagales bacterium WSM2-2]|nr:alkyl hydroperoxide reductase AhpD [Cytophagales bacterium WSM2-2]